MEAEIHPVQFRLFKRKLLWKKSCIWETKKRQNGGIDYKTSSNISLAQYQIKHADETLAISTVYWNSILYQLRYFSTFLLSKRQFLWTSLKCLLYLKNGRWTDSQQELTWHVSYRNVFRKSAVYVLILNFAKTPLTSAAQQGYIKFTIEITLLRTTMTVTAEPWGM